jgi:Ni,Fe-hydrogenase I large subunit
VPDNGRIIRNLGMGANIVMSHILHFYHLVALDYVDVNGTGLIPKGFLAPNYNRQYYARGIDPTISLAAPAYTVNNAPVASGLIPAAVLGDLTPYLAGQYIRALKARRQAQQLGALFTGKMPQASSYTPGCVTTKSYDPAIGGADAAVVQKVHELLYGGPAFTPTAQNGSTSTTNHPLNGNPISLSNPHPESLLGFIGKPANFWTWKANGYSPHHLPPWAIAGIPGKLPQWKDYTGTHMFDVVAAAHIFPEYFWVGAGYGRYLAWGIFEGGKADGISIMNFPDKRLITRGRSHVPYNAKGSGTPYSMTFFDADHLQIKEYITNSWYDDPKGKLYGRHPWSGKTNADRDAVGYTYAKSPRYLWAGSEGGPDDYVPYEVGPLARAMSNARGLSTPGGPATAGEVTAVNNGQAYAYYPGILKDVDNVLGPIGVLPGWGANAAATMQFLFNNNVLFWPAGLLPQIWNNQFHADYMGGATLDRIAARALEAYFVAAQMLSWFNHIDPTKKSNKTLFYSWGSASPKTAPSRGKGAGLTEAPRGALGHWTVIGKPKKNAKYKKFRGKVSNYQIITPTAWNISPKDHNGAMGPGERCVWGTPVLNPAEPIEILRVIHSFDYCCACTVHVTDSDKKEEVFKARLDPCP